MTLKKLIPILLASTLPLLFSFSAIAEKKLDSMDAIWSSLNATQSKHAAAQTKIKNQPPRQATKQLTRKQYQEIFKKKEEEKLAKQRAAWRAKWEADQRAKGITVVNTQTAPKSTNVNKIAEKPKPLTRAQYQWRWKQAQLQKQAQESKLPTAQKTLKKAKTGGGVSTKQASQAQFRSSKQPALLQNLPLEVVQKLQGYGVKKYGMSVFVQDVNSPKPLLAYQDTISRVPASVMKLITSYAALGTLGANYRWPLDILTTGTIKAGTLHGDLIVKGYGSPEFDTAALKKVLQGIRRAGIRNINGRIVFDNSYFNTLSQHAGAFDGKSHASYNARPDALLFNERLNVFNLRASGKGVKITSLTPTHNLKVVNRMKRYKRSCKPRLRISRRGQQTIATFTGGLARRCGTRSYAKVISNPANMIYGSMRSMWKREVGGKLNTRFATGRAPAHAKRLLRTYSRTLAQILPTIDKDSNNVMARQLLLTIGAKKSGRQGTERNGADAVNAWLVSRGLNFPELRIENGSGLSRYARISARHVGDLLMDAYRSRHRNILMQSLAIAGVDGTMKKRLRGTQVRGRGYFKTGTLRDVRSIAGYVKAANGRTYVVSILHNDPKARRRATPAHDKLIEWVYTARHNQHQLAMR